MAHETAPLAVEELREPPAGFLRDAVEGEAFCRAFQAARVDNFTIGYLRVSRAGRVISTVPYFVTRYALNTALAPGLLKSLMRPFGLRIACVGHPIADFGAIDGEVSAEVLSAVNRALEAKAPIVAYKDFPADLPLAGFSREPGMPVAVLDVPPDYWSRLDPHERTVLRRRMRRTARGVRIEERDGYPAELGPSIYRLYLNAHARAEVVFERLNPAFFEQMGPLAKYMLYWEGEQLIGFCLLLCRGKRMHAKYMGMDYERGRAHGLYFAMILSHLDVCVRDGYTYYNSGPSSYAFKQKVGSVLHPVYLHFRHRNAWLNRAIAIYMRLASFDATPASGADAPVATRPACRVQAAPRRLSNSPVPVRVR